MDLKHLRYFLAVASEDTFTAAGRIACPRGGRRLAPFDERGLDSDGPP
ncbi:hypothetical protein GCM10027445_50200 [Amycolatopsis endophytica]